MKLTWSSIKSFSLGFLLFFIAVIVADIYGGAGVTNLYYAGALLLCLSSVPKMIKRRVVPIELILYLILIVVVEFRNGQSSKFYFFGLVQLASVVLVATYLSTPRKIGYFITGLALSLFLSSIYFLLFATNDVLKAIDSELRHALPFFSVSSAGLMTALGYLLGFVFFLSRKDFKWLLLCLVCLAACLYTLSKNALLAIIIITVIYLFMSGVVRLSKEFWIIIGVLAVFILFGGGLLNPILKLYSEAIDTNNSYGIVSIAGRGSIWLYCIRTIPESPWVGNGYYTAIENMMSSLGEEFGQAHNCILHCLLSTGVVGLVLLTVYVVRLIIFIKRHYKIIMRFTFLRWVLCVLMYFVLRGLTEASISQNLSLDVFWFFLLSLVMMGLVKRIEAVRKKKINENLAGKPLPVS